MRDEMQDKKQLYKDMIENGRVMGLEKRIASNREAWRKRIRGPVKPC